MGTGLVSGGLLKVTLPLPLAPDTQGLTLVRFEATALPFFPWASPLPPTPTHVNGTPSPST